MRAAVIGAGPAGFYTAQALLNKFPACTIDILERLPVPFGLVRYGVAPDHPATKNVINHFSNMMSQNRDRVNFFGNVTVGEGATITPHDLSDQYDLTLYATGAARPRSLDIQLPSRRVHSAHDFVLWMNSHPDAYTPAAHGSVAERIEADLEDAEDIAVVGVGNVAIDIARVLLRPVDDLATTDIAPNCLDLLSQSTISSVTLIGRKNPARAAWTTAALREVVAKIPGITTFCDHALIKRDQQHADIPRAKASALKLLLEKSIDSNSAFVKPPRRQKALRLEFLKSPMHFDLIDDRVNVHLRDEGSGAEVPNEGVYQSGAAANTSEHDSVFLSLGYIGDSGGEVRVGWANESASGIIGNNKWDAESVVSQIQIPQGVEKESKRAAGPPPCFSSALHELVTWDGWLRIDAEEKRRATESTKPLSRLKLRNVSEMLEVANGICHEHDAYSNHETAINLTET